MRAAGGAQAGKYKPISAPSAKAVKMLQMLLNHSKRPMALTPKARRGRAKRPGRIPPTLDSRTSVFFKLYLQNSMIFFRNYHLRRGQESNGVDRNINDRSTTDETGNFLRVTAEHRGNPFPIVNHEFDERPFTAEADVDDVGGCRKARRSEERRGGARCRTVGSRERGG